MSGRAWRGGALLVAGLLAFAQLGADCVDGVTPVCSGDAAACDPNVVLLEAGASDARAEAAADGASAPGDAAGAETGADAGADAPTDG